MSPPGNEYGDNASPLINRPDVVPAMSGLQHYQIGRLMQEMHLKMVPGTGSDRMIDAHEVAEDTGYLRDERYSAPSGSWHAGTPVVFITNLRLIEGRPIGASEYVLPQRLELMPSSAEYLTRIHLYFVETTIQATRVYAVAAHRMDWPSYKGRDGLYHIPMTGVRWPVFPSAGPNLRFQMNEWSPARWKQAWEEAEISEGRA